jgi:putative oxidoreductase
LKWQSFGPELLSALRIVAGLMFLLAGTMKMFAFPAGMPTGGTAVFGSQIWIGGALEVVCGTLLTVGLFTRPAAFLMAGQMAVAYLQFHVTRGGFWPTLNGGVAAALYCFVWLYFSAVGAGPWSLDARRGR